MKYLAICIVFLAFAGCYAQKHKRCKAVECQDVEVLRQHVIKFPYGCLDSDRVSEWRKCVCGEMDTVECPGDKFNNCTRTWLTKRDDSHKGCEDCDSDVLKEGLAKLDGLNFNCFCTRFLGYSSNCLCSDDWEKCSGARMNKCYQDAFDALPDV